MHRTPFFDTSRLFAWKEAYPNEWQRIVTDILSTYLDVSQPYYNGSIRYFMDGDRDSLLRVLKDFKKTSRDIGAELLAECLAELESAVQRSELQKFGDNLACLNFIYFQTVDEVESLLAFLRMRAMENAS